MKIKFAIILITLLCSLDAFAQHKVQTYVHLSNIRVQDSYTGEFLQNACVLAFDESMRDSLGQVKEISRADRKTFNGFIVHKTNDIVLQVTCEGYDTLYAKVEVPKKQYGRVVNSWDCRLTLNLNRKLKAKTLKEATVTATKIIMVQRGDTTVFNASAFVLPEGTMLDGLIAKLPNMKIDKDGRISMNGVFVQSLMVNGRNFFNGNAQVALRNLPSYTVKDIKVYRKLTKEMELRGDTAMRKRPLVMDVGLKREYMKSWLSNYEVAGGTRLGGWNDVWMARLFALRNTKQSTVSFYGNANNLNDAQSPEVDGEWKSLNLEDGEKTTYLGGAFLNVEGSRNPVKFSSTLECSRQTSFTENRSNALSYYATGNTRSASDWQSDRRYTHAKWQSQIGREWRNGMLDVSFDASYSHTNRYYKSVNESYKESDMNSYALAGSDEMLAQMLYERQQSGKFHSYYWNGNAEARYFVRLPWDGNFFSVTGAASFSDLHSTERTFDHIGYADGSLQPDVQENKFFDTPSRDYSFSLTGSYEPFESMRRWRKPLSMSIDYQYTQVFRSNHRLLQNQEDTTGNSASYEKMLPSLLSAQTWVTDMKNSYHTTQMEKTHSLKPSLKYEIRKVMTIGFTPELKFTKRRINDLRSGNAQSLSPRNVLFEPEANLSKRIRLKPSGEWRFNLQYSLSHTLPSLLHLLDVRDDSDPLYRSLGNPHLKVAKEHFVLFTSELETRGMRDYKNRWEVHFSQTQNDYAMGRTYNPETGVTTVMPQNINGNRTWTVSDYQSLFLDQHEHWWMENKITYKKRHAVDFNDYGISDKLERMAVSSHMVQDAFRLDYRFKKVTLSGKADIKWTRQWSDVASFRSQHFTDFSYGMEMTTPLVWGFDFDTELTAYCRRGYSDDSFNTTEWVWNATLSRALGVKKLWVVKLKGCDILHQRSNVRRTIGVTGRTEMWYNTIPSYVTLHLLFRVNSKTKK